MSTRTMRKIINNFGFDIRKLGNAPINNVFGRKQSDKKVLISFDTNPFTLGINKRHTVGLECMTAAKAFAEMDYLVDVIPFDSEIKYELDDYDVLYGFGEPLEKSFYGANAAKVCRVAYMNGCSPVYALRESALRVKAAYERTGVMMPESSRILEKTWRLQTIMSNYIITLGNSFVRQTYLNENKDLPVHNINAFFFDVIGLDEIRKKDFKKSRKNFLWFGSSGAVHKGLDLLIEVFAQRSDVNLHICGLSKSEFNFLRVYGAIIERSENIINHGFIDLDSDNFKQIMFNCGSVIFPSASEGGAVSVLNVVANGALFPILSSSTGLDLQNIGMELLTVSKDSIHSAIDEYLKLPEKDVIDRSMIACQTVRQDYTYSKYEHNLKSKIANALSISQR
jgi:glycosyltransferase involved in cell wall biosynthesis